MRDRKPLFAQGRLQEYLDSRTSALRDSIARMPDAALLSTEEDELIEQVVAAHEVRTPRFREDEVEFDEADQLVDIDVSRDPMRDIRDRSRPFFLKGRRFTLRIPFDGHSEVFRLQPNSFKPVFPYADVDRNEVTRDFDELSDGPQLDLDAEAERLLSELRWWLAKARGQTEAHRDQLERDARAAIRRRRQEADRSDERVRQTKIPVRRAGATTPRIPTTIKRIRREAANVRGQAANERLRTALSDHDYEHILKVVRGVGRGMSRNPGTYTRMGEEQRRNVIVTTLGTHYEGQAMAEALNVSGKTDILIRENDENLVIAECKAWKGKASLTTALEQLLGYTTWADTRLALVMFVPQRGLSDVVAKAKAALADHNAFVRSRESGFEDELRCELSWPGDRARRLQLAVILVHIPG